MAVTDGALGASLSDISWKSSHPTPQSLWILLVTVELGYTSLMSEMVATGGHLFFAPQSSKVAKDCTQDQPFTADEASILELHFSLCAADLWARLGCPRCLAVQLNSRLIYVLTHSMAELSSHSRTHSLTAWPSSVLTHSLTHSLTSWPSSVLTHSLTHSMAELTHSHTHSHHGRAQYSLTHSQHGRAQYSLTHSFTHSLTAWPNSAAAVLFGGLDINMIRALKGEQSCWLYVPCRLISKPRELTRTRQQVCSAPRGCLARMTWLFLPRTTDTNRRHVWQWKLMMSQSGF